MPLKLDIKRTLSARSDRVKSVDLHPSEPWMMAALYNGNVHIWNLESQQLIKTFEVCDVPVRTAKFIARKNWITTGSDDMNIRIYNYNTLERVHAFEAHSDYIRCIVVHPTSPFILSSGDDMVIKLWDWDKKWVCAQIYEGHTHYVMQLVINPKDNNTFASASLDKTIKVWSLGSGTANFTTDGHEKGVNCLDYYNGGDKPYLVSGADDRLVKVWDHQSRACVQTLEGHAQNISAVAFHPELPIIITGSEDGTIRIWHAHTYRLETTLNYGLERVWSISCLKKSNSVAIGYDEGSIVIKIGREEPAMSMDANGRLVYARHADIHQGNIKTLGNEIGDYQDGEKIPLTTKELGACEFYPQTISHNSNGRLFVVCGDGEYNIYTAMGGKVKHFGQAQEFAWSTVDPNVYAIRNSSGTIHIFKNFQEERNFRPDFGVEMIFGGVQLAIRSASGLAFYDWNTGTLIRRIEVTPRAVFWNDSGVLVSIVTEEAFYVLRYDPNIVENSTVVDEDGIEDAFNLIWNGEINETVKNGVWVGDCFLYTNSSNRLQYCVGGEIVTVAHLERHMYLLGYIPKENKVFLADRGLQIVSYTLLLSVLEYQTLVMRGDLETADSILGTIPYEQKPRVARFLEKQGFFEKALDVTTDNEHKFELALQLNKLHLAFDIVNNDADNSTDAKWKQIADIATKSCQFNLAQQCMVRAKDYASLMVLASSSGNKEMMTKLSEKSQEDGLQNIAFLSKFVLGDSEACLKLLIDSKRYAEAAFFARAYLPSHIPETVNLWKADVASKGYKKIAESLANPDEYPNLFPRYDEMKATEKRLHEESLINQKRRTTDYVKLPHSWERNPIEEKGDNVTNGDLLEQDLERLVIDNNQNNAEIISSTEELNKEIEDEMMQDAQDNDVWNDDDDEEDEEEDDYLQAKSD